MYSEMNEGDSRRPVAAVKSVKKHSRLSNVKSKCQFGACRGDFSQTKVCVDADTVTGCWDTSP